MEKTDHKNWTRQNNKFKAAENFSETKRNFKARLQFCGFKYTNNLDPDLCSFKVQY